MEGATAFWADHLPEIEARAGAYVDRRFGEIAALAPPKEA